MRKLGACLVLTLAGTTLVPEAEASAATYPTAAGTTILLDSSDFVQSVLQSEASAVVGHNLFQHPGASYAPAPTPGSPFYEFPPLPFFIGILGNPVDSSDASVSVYLWENSYPGLSEDGQLATITDPFPGPLIQLGNWNAPAFTPCGNEVAASYLGTKTYWRDPGDGIPKEITSSVTPLSAFGVTSGCSANRRTG